MKHFKSKYGPWAVITGATDGIGKAIAEELGARGINLVLIARREDVLKNFSDQLQFQFHIKTLCLAMDVSTMNSVQLLKDALGGFDVGLFVAAAGFGSSGHFVELPISQELNMVDVNCRAVVEQSHFFANQMKLRKQGGIVLLSSLVAFQGTPFSATYSATKSFIQNFAEALHFELKDQGIDVLASAPGPVHSGFASRAKMRMGSAAQPAEVAIATLDALGHSVTVRPGFLSKFLGYSLLTLNRWGRIQAMKRIMSGMTGS